MYKDFKYKLAEDTINKFEISKLCQWLKRTKKLTQGKTVKKFQENFSKYLKVKNSIFVIFHLLNILLFLILMKGTIYLPQIHCCLPMVQSTVREPSKEPVNSVVTWSNQVHSTLWMRFQEHITLQFCLTMAKNRFYRCHSLSP